MAKKLSIHSKDKIVHDVIKKFDDRSAVGLKKYGTTLATDSDSLYRWVNDVQEELMDAILYLQKVKATMTEVMEESYIKDYADTVMDDSVEYITDEDGKGAINYTCTYPGDVKVTFNDEPSLDG